MRLQRAALAPSVPEGPKTSRYGRGNLPPALGNLPRSTGLDRFNRVMFNNAQKRRPMTDSQVKKSSLLTYRQAAKRLNVCLNTTRTLVDNGELPRVTVGKRGVRTTEAGIEAYIERNTK